MIDTIVTGYSGFIGSRLGRSIDSKYVKHENIVYGHSYCYDKMFFLSTYGNMAHHDNHSLMVKANVFDLLTILNGFTGWICYMSSSSVNLPVQTPYSRTKRAAEEILQALPELKSCIIRPYSVTGVGEQKEHLIPTLIRSCMEGEPMDFVPDATHDFVDVEDVVSGMMILSKIEARGIYEFGNGTAVTNEEVRRLVQEITGKKANIRNVVVSLRDYDDQNWCCGTTNDYWQSTKSLKQSITEMVEEYKLTLSKNA